MLWLGAYILRVVISSCRTDHFILMQCFFFSLIISLALCLPCLKLIYLLLIYFDKYYHGIFSPYFDLCVFIFKVGFMYTTYSWVLLFIHFDNCCLLIVAFRPLMFKVIIDIVELISAIFVIVFYLLFLFFVPVFLSTLLQPFVVLIEYFMIPISLLS